MQELLISKGPQDSNVQYRLTIVRYEGCLHIIPESIRRYHIL
jgi:hypothetical protein